MKKIRYLLGNTLIDSIDLLLFTNMSKLSGIL